VGGQLHLDREQAMTVLKELVSKDLVEPSYVHIFEKTPKNYQIQIKCNYNRNQIIEFAKTKQLTIMEDKEQKYLVIYKV
jgi:hypothetical protein